MGRLFDAEAASRPFVVRLFLIYGLLVIATGPGVRRSAAPQRSLRIAAILLVADGAVALAGPLVTTMDSGIS